MAKVLAYVLDGGATEILSASSGFLQYKPYSFSVGDAAGFVPLTSETVPRGNIVFSADSNSTQSRVVSSGTTRFSCLISEGAGPFLVGNIVLNLIDQRGIVIPAIMVVLPYAIPKKISGYDTGTVGLAVPGNRFLINITLTQQIVTGSTANVNLSVQIISPEYTNLSYLDTESNLPSPELMPWSQLILQQADLTKGPAFITKDANDHYWIMPFLKEITDPEYNVIAGGYAGDNYVEVDYPVLWGHRLKTPDGSYKNAIGFAPLKGGTIPDTVGFAPIQKQS